MSSFPSYTPTHHSVEHQESQAAGSRSSFKPPQRYSWDEQAEQLKQQRRANFEEDAHGNLVPKVPSLLSTLHSTVHLIAWFVTSSRRKITGSHSWVRGSQIAKKATAATSHVTQFEQLKKTVSVPASIRPPTHCCLHPASIFLLNHAALEAQVAMPALARHLSRPPSQAVSLAIRDVAFFFSSSFSFSPIFVPPLAGID